MSKATNENVPMANVNRLDGNPICSCPSCACLNGKHVVKGPMLEVNLKAEHYSIALREEGEARQSHATALANARLAEEALSDAIAQTTLARADLFKSCGL